MNYLRPRVQFYALRIVFLTSAILLSLFLKAQDFEVAPVVMQFKTDPGNTETRKLYLRNHFNETQKITLNLVDYTLNEDGKKISQEAGSTDRSLVDRITISPSVVELKPNESTEAEVIMTVPMNDSRTRWGMIQVQVAEERTAASADKELVTGVKVVPRIVVVVTQSPSINTNFSASVDKVVEVEPSSSGMRRFEVTILNQGDKVIVGDLYLAIADLRTAEQKKMNKQQITVYPDATKKVILTLSEKLKPGEYALAALFDYSKDKSIEGAQIKITQE